MYESKVKIGWAATFGVCSFLPTKSAFMVLSARRHSTFLTWQFVACRIPMHENTRLMSSAGHWHQFHITLRFTALSVECFPCANFMRGHLAYTTTCSSALHRASKWKVERLYAARFLP